MMIYKGQQYEKLTERIVKGGKYIFYRLSFNDIKQVSGDLYLMEKIKNDKSSFKKVKKIKDKVTKPSIWL